jgi:hypothetical protein
MLLTFFREVLGNEYFYGGVAFATHEINGKTQIEACKIGSEFVLK